MCLRKSIISILASLAFSSSFAVEVSFTSQGLDFTINNDDPFNATINFDTYKLSLDEQTSIFTNPKELTTTETVVEVEITPQPNPLPFPPHPEIKTVTTTTTTYTGGFERVAQIFPVNDILIFGVSGPAALNVVDSTRATFSNQLNYIAPNIDVHLTHTEMGEKRVTTTTEVFENNVLVSSDTAIISTEPFINIALDETYQMGGGAYVPGSVSPAEFPDAAPLNGPLGFTYSFQDLPRNYGCDDYIIPYAAPLFCNNQGASQGPYRGLVFSWDSQTNEFDFQQTTVPIPASSWLFMSALAGLIGKKRLSRP